MASRSRSLAVPAPRAPAKGGLIEPSFTVGSAMPAEASARHAPTRTRPGTRGAPERQATSPTNQEGAQQAETAKEKEEQPGRK